MSLAFHALSSSLERFFRFVGQERGRWGSRSSPTWADTLLLLFSLLFVGLQTCDEDLCVRTVCLSALEFGRLLRVLARSSSSFPTPLFPDLSLPETRLVLTLPFFGHVHDLQGWTAAQQKFASSGPKLMVALVDNFSDPERQKTLPTDVVEDLNRIQGYIDERGQERVRDYMVDVIEEGLEAGKNAPDDEWDEDEDEGEEEGDDGVDEEEEPEGLKIYEGGGRSQAGGLKREATGGFDDDKEEEVINQALDLGGRGSERGQVEGSAITSSSLASRGDTTSSPQHQHQQQQHNRSFSASSSLKIVSGGSVSSNGVPLFTTPKELDFAHQVSPTRRRRNDDEPSYSPSSSYDRYLPQPLQQKRPYHSSNYPRHSSSYFHEEFPQHPYACHFGSEPHYLQPPYGSQTSYTSSSSSSSHYQQSYSRERSYCDERGNRNRYSQQPFPPPQHQNDTSSYYSLPPPPSSSDRYPSPSARGQKQQPVYNHNPLASRPPNDSMPSISRPKKKRAVTQPQPHPSQLSEPSASSQNTIHRVYPSERRQPRCHRNNQGRHSLGEDQHIDVACKYGREAQRSGFIKVNYCPTEEMKADILTKAQ